MATFQAFLDESHHRAASARTSDAGGEPGPRVLTAVVVRSTDRPTLDAALAAHGVPSRDTGAANLTTRLARLQMLETLDLTVVAAVFDADATARDGGPVDPASLDRFLHGLLHRAMVQRHPDVNIRLPWSADDGRAGGFAAWLEAHHPARDLFSEARIVPVQPADGPLLAVAAFLSDTLAAAFGPPGHEELRAALRQWMQEGRLGIDQWPTRLATGTDDDGTAPAADAGDTAVRDLALAMAERFIDTHRTLSSDELLRQQSLTVGYLLFQAKFEAGRHASAAELIGYLGTHGHTVSDHQLKSTVIAPLRDQDVLISSSSRGYKIPQNRQDFLNFMRLVDGQTLPLLDRLQRARRSLARAGVDLDALTDQPRFARLKRVMEALGEPEPPVATVVHDDMA